MSASSQQPRMGLGCIMIAATQKTRAIAKVMAKMEIHIRAPRVCAMCAVQFLAVSAPSVKRLCPHVGCWFPSNKPRAQAVSAWRSEFMRDAQQPNDGKAFCVGSRCLSRLGIVPLRTRRLRVSRTRAIWQPSGSMWPFRLRAWTSPCVHTRRHAGEILPMDSRRTSSNGADDSRPSPRQLGGSPIYKKRHTAAQQGGPWRQSAFARGARQGQGPKLQKSIRENGRT
jgi:hypothetical protein